MLVDISVASVTEGPGAFPEWRWLRASSAIQDRKRSPCFERDPGVRAAIDFLEMASQCVDQFDWERLKEKWPDEYTAVSFWVDPVTISTDTPKHRRPPIFQVRRHATLEAYLLAQLRHDTIAGKIGMSTAAVAIYENWFYDFRPHFNNTVWVTTKGIRGDIAGSNGCSFENILRLYGWKYGAGRVDDLLSGTGFDADFQRLLRDDMLGQLLKSSVIQSREIHHQVTLFEATRGMLETSDRLREAEIAAGQDFRSKSERNYIEQIEERMRTRKWCMVEVPDQVSQQLPAVESRLAVQLGYDKDYSTLPPPPRPVAPA